MGCDYTNPDHWCFYVPQCKLNTTWGCDGPSLYNPNGPDEWCRNGVYCEDFLTIPEYASAFTAIVISFMAMYQITLDHPIEITRCLSAFVFMHGVVSCINHWTGALIFSYLDNVTMCLPLYIMTGIVATKFVRRHGGLLSPAFSGNYYIRYMIRLCVWILFIGFVIVLLFNDWTLDPLEGLFVTAFGIPLVFLAIMAIAVMKTKAVENMVVDRFLRANKNEDNLQDVKLAIICTWFLGLCWFWFIVVNNRTNLCQCQRRTIFEIFIYT